MVVTVKRIGGRLAVLIPRPIVAEANLAEGTSLDVTNTAEGILFQRPNRRPRRPIARIAKEMIPSNYARRNDEFSADGPVGKEL